MGRLSYLLSVLLIVSQSVMGDDGYRLPPQEVVDIVAAQPEPSISISPDGQWFLLIERKAMPSIENLASRRLLLAGIRIDPKANGLFRSDYSIGLLLRHRDNEANAVRVPLPIDARLGSVHWSHTSRAFGFTLVTDKGTQLWSASIDKPSEPHCLTDRLSTIFGSVSWMTDGRSLVCRLTPENRRNEPSPPRRPFGPNIQETSGKASPVRTYQDLLTSGYDAELFEHYATTQLAIIDLDGGVRTIGEPRMYESVRVSPDGRHLLVVTIKRPFSYLLPYSSFPKDIAVWNLAGDQVYMVAEVPLEENIPIEGVRTGPRNVVWASSEPSRLMWFDALDDGDPRKKVAHRDRVMTIAAPFREEPREIVKLEHRGIEISFFKNPAWLSTTEYDRDRRWVRQHLHEINQQVTKPKVLMDRSIRDQYGDPGDIVSEITPSGHVVARQDGDWIYLSGNGASPLGSLPFVDRRNLSNFQTERLWRCEPGFYESLAAIATSSVNSRPSIITKRESPSFPPNLWLRDVEKNSAKALTSFRDPTPQVRTLKKQLVTYKRADGVPLSATLYLPSNYQPGTRLPLLVWAYPVEFSDANTAGQVTTSPAQFTRIRAASHLTLLTQGFAVMDNATMPVVGEPETMNDTFIEQIVAGAQAAIDKAVELGVADRQRVGVGGHSYGGFMTANLMAHSNLFRAGIARSGAYNRTLTPFGFQSERRPFWQAKSIYMNVSPFMHADKINEPLLLIHGENDNNAGTFPLQSQRLYQAIKGNGGTARLVMLPYESHGYEARESILHVQAEMIDWMNRYVKNAVANQVQE